ncbi:MAG: SDR family oxidoreductase [Bacteroidia bacterium]|nr:SDR family oxidoreductase [Bacteroidia bacterium]
MVLVTGATGFLGSHLVCQLLAAGKQVRACMRKTSDKREFNFIFHHYFGSDQNAQMVLQRLIWVEADVLEIDTLSSALDGVEHVYHVAALVSFDAADRDLLMKVNVEGTANVVNLCLILGIKKLSYVSSIASLGRTKSGNTMDENSTWEASKLNSNYAISKYKAEMEVWRGSEEGLSVIIVNPGVIIGVGDFSKGSNALVQTIYKGMPLYSMGVNGYVDVKDVARALLEIEKAGIYNRRFVLVGANMRFRDLFFMIADGFGKKRPYIQVTPFMAAIAWRVMAVVRLFSKKGLALTKETARAALNESYYNSNRIISEIDFAFTPIEKTVADCVGEYAAWELG